MFNEGDFVKHRAGGPRMVVASRITGFGPIIYECTWFDDNSRMKENFAEAELEAYRERVFSDGPSYVD
jgi:uncharacterized protein YodC (DUF2158 family)